MNALQEDAAYTVEDIYALPEGERAELIDGQIYYMAAPGRKHQQLLGAVYRKIADYIDSHGGECEVDIAPFAVFLNRDSKNYVEPDISVVCDKGKLDDRGCFGAPDWIIEIVSPSSRSMDYFKKLFKYRSAGVREYWVVDSERQSVTVYNFEQDDMVEYSFGEEIPVGLYQGFSLTI
ncbi:Uma2 family endonuclease [bacterium D16-51]|nr:Uma2 family endonuclease [bacterium D16-59]RKI62281.1 Uma2 family endonuclease [bacterium D16-51]